MRDDRHGLDRSFGFDRVEPRERQRRIRDVFRAVAPRYDLMNDLMSFGIHRLWKRRLVRNLPLADPVVDLAGGTGDVARLLAAAGAGAVLVIDPSEPMMRAGRPASDRCIRWLAAEGERLPLRDRSVGTLTVSFGLRNVTRLADALTEIRRVLKPGGCFACL